MTIELRTSRDKAAYEAGVKAGMDAIKKISSGIKDYLGRSLNEGDICVVVKKTSGSTDTFTAGFVKAKIVSFKKSLIELELLEDGGFCRGVGRVILIAPNKTIRIQEGG